MYSLEPPRRGGSNEYPQSLFLSRNKKINAYPCKPQFYYIKVGFKGSELYRRVLVMMDVQTGLELISADTNHKKFFFFFFFFFFYKYFG